MGYTRYWERTEKPLTEDFVEEVKKIIIDSAKKGIAIRGYDGYCMPELTTERISFNGNSNAERVLSCESFVIDNVKIGFDFCKTARKPYDYTVRKVLKLAKDYGLVTKVSSDGANNKVYSDEEYISGLVNWN